VAGNEGVLFTGGSGAIPATGAGKRLMWHPAKAAFRAGDAVSSEWDDFAVGTYSAALGRGTTASGSNSFAAGADTTASGQYATALGRGAVASGQGAFAVCPWSTDGNGSGTTASGHGAVAIGQSNVSSGWLSTAFGFMTTASGDHSIAAGRSGTARSYASVVFGSGGTASGNPTAWVSTDPLFVVGNATPGGSGNGLTYFKNGDMTIAGTLTQNSDARLKADIRPLTGALGRLSGVRGVTYRFKDDASGPAGPQIGLLAQEVREAFPELVHEDAQGKLSVAYGNFCGVLLAALRKELELAKKETEDRLARLEAAPAATAK
jgi:hypothetical protein